MDTTRHIAGKRFVTSRPKLAFFALTNAVMLVLLFYAIKQNDGEWVDFAFLILGYLLFTATLVIIILSLLKADQILIINADGFLANDLSKDFIHWSEVKSVYVFKYRHRLFATKMLTLRMHDPEKYANKLPPRKRKTYRFFSKLDKSDRNKDFLIHTIALNGSFKEISGLMIQNFQDYKDRTRKSK